MTVSIFKNLEALNHDKFCASHNVSLYLHKLESSLEAEDYRRALEFNRNLTTAILRLEEVSKEIDKYACNLGPIDLSKCQKTQIDLLTVPSIDLINELRRRTGEK